MFFQCFFSIRKLAPHYTQRTQNVELKELHQGRFYLNWMHFAILYQQQTATKQRNYFKMSLSHFNKIQMLLTKKYVWKTMCCMLNPNIHIKSAPVAVGRGNWQEASLHYWFMPTNDGEKVGNNGAVSPMKKVRAQPPLTCLIRLWCSSIQSRAGVPSGLQPARDYWETEGRYAGREPL